MSLLKSSTRRCQQFITVNFCFLLLLLAACSERHDSNHAQENASKSHSSELVTTFEKEIIPIFESRCSVSCHGVDKNNFEQFLLKDPINKVAFYFPYNSQTGTIEPTDYANIYQVAIEHGRVNYAENAKFSHLLRAPLAQEYGGQPHQGLDVFYSTADKDYQTMVRWLSREIDAHKKELAPLPENIVYFRNTILGVMERNSCFLSSCHNNQVFNDLKLEPPLPSFAAGTSNGIEQRFSTEMVLKNRNVMLGSVSRLANLGGDLTKSRLIAKNIPISEGGIHQRGGNNQFFESLEDADVKRLLTWLSLERQVLAKNLTSENKAITEGELGKINGIVFIRGPRHSPRRWFSFDQFYPGSDIFLLPLKEGETLASATGEAINITAAFHDQPVEIQSLDVRYDTKRILFSMRAQADRGFRLYEVRLNESLTDVTGKPVQISFAAKTLADGTLIHHIDPIYMAGPADKKGHELGEVAISFASNEAGQYAQSEAWGIVGEADSSNGKVLFDKQRPEAAGTFNGRRISVVAGPNKGQWRTITKHESAPGKGNGAQLILDRPLPHQVDRKTIYVIEQEQGLVQSSYDIWRFIPRSVQIPDNEHPALHDIGRGVEELKGLTLAERFQQSRVQITYSHAQERRPTVRTTGETMFTSVRNIGYQGDKPVYNGAIYRTQAGGFDYHIQGGNRSGYALFSDSRELANGLEIRQLHDPRNLWNGGMLTLSDHGFGINAEPDNPMDDNIFSIDADSAELPFSSPPRFIPAQINFFDQYGENAVTHTGVSPGGSVRDPYPLPNGSVLTSYTPNELNHLDQSADPDWDIYSFKFQKSPHTENGDRVGDFQRLKIVAASSELAEYSARPLMLRLKEKVTAPLHHQKFGSRSLATKPKEEFGVLRMPAGLPGEIECYDYPLLQSFLTNFTPVGSKDFRIEQGSPDGSVTPSERLFKYVRIVMQVSATKAELTAVFNNSSEGDPFASAVSSGIHGKRVIVAEVPIEDDGSFYVEVPTNVPLIVQGLNEDKMAMHGMNRWLYLQPGEKLTLGIPRSIYPLRCAGCHGSLTGEPLDGVGPADLVSAASRVMATWNFSEQKRRLAYGFGSTSDNYISVDFQQDVQPILDKNCVVCHNSANDIANLDLRNIPSKHYNKAYESLHQLTDTASGNYAAKKYINEREALSSESVLIQSLTNKNANAHLAGNNLSKDELITLIRWVDLGATYIGGTNMGQAIDYKNANSKRILSVSHHLQHTIAGVGDKK